VPSRELIKFLASGSDNREMKAITSNFSTATLRQKETGLCGVKEMALRREKETE